MSAPLSAIPADVSSIVKDTRPIPVLVCGYSPTVGAVPLQAGGASADGLFTQYGSFQTAIQGINGNSNGSQSSQTAFWNAAAVGASGVSASAQQQFVGKLRIRVNTSVADTLNLQMSIDGGTTWYTLTQDNAGTLWIIATTATSLIVCRDASTFGSALMRLFNVTAATVTAGYESMSV